MTGSQRPSRIVRAAGWSTSVQAVPPALASSIVHRPRLEDRLDGATQRRLTVIVAGAGAGKSTLLADWAVRRGAAWYTLTETDRDLMQLGIGILGALALRVPALPGAVAGLLERTLGPESAGDERSAQPASRG
jgi:ATP/maltotriose-dependent transcriptional regulator MalT